MKRVSVLREGEKNAWLEIILDEGKNRQIRKILSELNFDVLRLGSIRYNTFTAEPYLRDANVVSFDLNCILRQGYKT